MPLCHAECMLQVVPGIGFGKVLEVNQLRPGDRGHETAVTHLWDISQSHCHPNACYCAAYLCLWMRALKASPSFQLEVKLVTFTWGYLQWEQGVIVTFWTLPGPDADTWGSHHLPCCFHLAPEQKCIPGRACLPALLRLHDDVLDLGAKRHSGVVTAVPWKMAPTWEGNMEQRDAQNHLSSPGSGG